MLDLLLESALRSLALGVTVWLGLALLRVRNPRALMTAWTVVLVASLAMPVLIHRFTVTVPAAAPPLRVLQFLSSTISTCSDTGLESVDYMHWRTRNGGAAAARLAKLRLAHA